MEFLYEIQRTKILLDPLTQCAGPFAMNDLHRRNACHETFIQETIHFWDGLIDCFPDDIERGMNGTNTRRTPGSERTTDRLPDLLHRFLRLEAMLRSHGDMHQTAGDGDLISRHFGDGTITVKRIDIDIGAFFDLLLGKRISSVFSSGECHGIDRTTHFGNMLLEIILCHR